MVALLMIAQLSAFLVGGIPFAFVIAKLHSGIDIRSRGSGNVGATNIGRLLGFRYFLLVFILDFLKGLLPVAIAIYFQGQFSAPKPDSPVILYLPEIVGFATILGHVFPVYLNLRGGKGVATTIGVISLLAPVPLLWGLAGFLVVLLLTRMVSAGSVAFASLFAMSYFLLTSDWSATDVLGKTLFVLAVSTMIFLKHWSNIGRIVQGTEAQIRLPWTPQ